VEGRSKEALAADIVLRDGLRNTYRPLKESELPEIVRVIIERMEPTFAQLIGQLGSGMHIYAFQAQDNKGKSLIRATQEGNFSVSFSGKVFNWHTPLVSLLPPKYCPSDNAEMQGDWLFCPYHGIKLAL
jgi:hypothetical protein